MIPKHLLINFDELKVGQRVWTLKSGYTHIKCIDPNDGDVLIITEDHFAFYRDGKFYRNDLIPSLFLDCPFIEEERVVEVSNNGMSWKNRVLITKTNGVFVTHYKAESIEQIDVEFNDMFPRWKFMRELQPEPIKENIESPKSVTMQDYILLKEINWFGKETIPSGTVYKQVDADAYWPVINGAEKPWMKVDFHTVKNNSEYFLEIKK